MKSDPSADLLPGEWAVLGVIADGPTHGFAVARMLAAEGDLGRVWTMSRPRVYRAIADLASRGLIAPVGEADSERGPSRVVYAVTHEGRDRLARWLATPVDHVRDVRSDLLLKLALLDRAGRSPRRLLAAQRETLTRIAASVADSRRAAAGFDAVMLDYRAASTQAVLAFVEEQLGGHDGDTSP